MLDWTPTLISTRRAGRFLSLGVVTVVLITAFAAPSTSAPRFRAGPDVTGGQAGRSSQWIAQPPLRQARGGLGVAKVGRHILAIGGFEVVGRVSTVFDVVEARRIRGSGRWRDLAPMPTAQANLATAEVGGLVYAIGGIGQAENTLDVVETFDPRSGRWTTSLPLPQPRAALGAAGLGGLLYVAGVRSSWLPTPSRSRTRCLSTTPSSTSGGRSPRCPPLGRGSDWWRWAATCTPSAGSRIPLARP
jgi:hypothetical protein